MSFEAGLCFNVARISTSICFSVGLFLAMLTRQLLNKIIIKHNIKKTQIHIFHNRFLGEVANFLQLFLVLSDSIRIVLEPAL